MSPAKDLGTRHTCWNCGTKFYDLKKPAPLCPKCGADQRESPALKEPPKAPKKAAVAALPHDEEEREETDEVFDEDEGLEAEDDDFGVGDEDEADDDF